MGIRWRLGILALQLVGLFIATAIVTGRPFATDTWFFAGLLAIVINRQLLEPYYPRPGDVIANAVIFALLYAVTPAANSETGWRIAAAVIALMGIFAIIGVLPSSRTASRRFDLARAARSISQVATAQRIYSVAFFLSLLEFRSTDSADFWILTGAWSLLIVLGNINWQSVWNASRREWGTCRVEGMLGPSIVTVCAEELPGQDTWVELVGASGIAAHGTVIKRISRKDDVWGQIHLVDSERCEKLLAEGEVAVRAVLPKEGGVPVGSVDAGSTDTSLVFIATRALELGQVVAVPQRGSTTRVLYQLFGAVVEHTDVKGGAHLFERARATQLGVFRANEHRFERHLWTSSPGAPVLADISSTGEDASRPPDGWERIGHVIGTTLPVYLDLAAASTGHVAILGMTKMGKSTLAERLARRLGESRCVTILDLTGEYVRKKGFMPYNKDIDLCAPGVSVYEPKSGEVAAERAENFLNYLLGKAQPEYQAGEPYPRTIIIDEAHQFIPEPAGLGFNAPGRDSSFRIGLLMMQVRKFGISVILISQRTAVVAKSALSQCENLIAFRNVDQTGLDYLEALAGSDVRHILPRLRQGEALVFGPAVSSDLPVAVDTFT